MNEKTYNLIMEILQSDLEREAKTEIVKFYTLPRNTRVKPMLELPDEEQLSQLGPIKRPDEEELEKRANPELEAEKKAMADTLKKHYEKE